MTGYPVQTVYPNLPLSRAGPGSTAQASGIPDIDDRAIPFFWVVMVLLLVLARVLYELAE